jgi:hypothetical protein
MDTDLQPGQVTSDADPGSMVRELGSWMERKPNAGSWIRNKHPRSYFLEHNTYNFWTLLRIRIIQPVFLRSSHPAVFSLSASLS